MSGGIRSLLVDDLECCFICESGFEIIELNQVDENGTYDSSKVLIAETADELRWRDWHQVVALSLHPPTVLGLLSLSNLHRQDMTMRLRCRRSLRFLSSRPSREKP